VFRMLVTGGPPVRGGGGMPQRTVTISVPVSRPRLSADRAARAAPATARRGSLRHQLSDQIASCRRSDVRKCTRPAELTTKVSGAAMFVHAAGRRLKLPVSSWK
jgi:hypothetical protein